MQRHELREIQEQNEYPSVSMFMPVFSASAPDRQQTTVRVKNLVRQAESRLLQEFERREIAGLLQKLEALATEVDPLQHVKGIALFVNRNYSRAVELPFEVEERIVINHTFVTRDLVAAEARMPRYRVLSLTEKSAHLFEGQGTNLTEAHHGGFPVTLQVSGVQSELPGTFGIDPSNLREAEEREYVQRVEKALCEVQVQEPLPLVLAGVQRTLAFLDEASGQSHRNQFNIVGRLHGNFANQSPRQLFEKAAEVVAKDVCSQREKTRLRLDEAIGPGRAALGLDSVWNEARKGRVDTLLVEEGFHQPARKKSNGLPNDRLEAVAGDGSHSPDLLDDAVDEAVEVVLGARGQVVFMPPGQLTAQGRIAAILRY